MHGGNIAVSTGLGSTHVTLSNGEDIFAANGHLWQAGDFI